MRTLLLTIVVPFVLVVIFLNSPLHDTGQAPITLHDTGQAPVTRTSPAMADYAARERAARERRIAAAEARAARESQNEIDAINVKNRAEYEQRNGGGAPPQRDVGSARRTSTPQPRMGARAWASRVQGELDSPMQDIQAQLAESGVSPTLSRQGDLRIFTYTFHDGSEQEFAAEPAGGQRGLVLYYVDIRD